MATLRAAALLALLTTPALAQTARRAIQWRNVTVGYNPADEDFARTALEAARTALPTLESALGLSHDRRNEDLPIRLDIAHRQADFDALAGHKTKPWVQGLALGGERRIVLKPLSPATMRTVTAHELTHVLLDTAAARLGATPPRWLHEGLAKLGAEDFSEADREILGEAAVQDRLLTIPQLEPAFAGDRYRVGLAYAQSYTLVRFLHELRPGGGLEDLLRNLALTQDVDRALLRVYGRPRPALEEEWLRQTTGEYLRRGIPLTTELLIFGAMALLALGAYAAQGRRRRLIRERLQAAERGEEEQRLRRMFRDTGGDTDDPFVD